jgi:hypothetical protein
MRCTGHAARIEVMRNTIYIILVGNTGMKKLLERPRKVDGIILKTL